MKNAFRIAWVTTALLLAFAVFSSSGSPWDSNRWGSGGQYEQENIVYLATDQTNETAVYADVTGLSFVPLANRDYLVEFFVIYTTSATTVGLDLAVNGPASPTAMVWINMINSSATAGRHYQFNSYDGGVTSTGAVADENIAYLFGLFRNGSTSGTLILRFAAESALTSVTIKAGSVLRYRKLN